MCAAQGKKLWCRNGAGHIGRNEDVQWLTTPAPNQLPREHQPALSCRHSPQPSFSYSS